MSRFTRDVKVLERLTRDLGESLGLSHDGPGSLSVALTGFSRQYVRRNRFCLVQEGWGHTMMLFDHPGLTASEMRAALAGASLSLFAEGLKEFAKQEVAARDRSARTDPTLS